MYDVSFGNFKLSLDLFEGCINSLKINARELLFAKCPIFTVGIRTAGGEQIRLCPQDAAKVEEKDGGAEYRGFGKGELSELSVRISLTEKDDEAEWRISVFVPSKELLCEWVEFPSVTLLPLSDGDGEKERAEVLFPYNEGALVSDLKWRGETSLAHKEAVYPSHGSYSVFPNMVCSQMLAYLLSDGGLYIGAHDPLRAVKEIDVFERDGGTAMHMRLFCGTDLGESYIQNFPIVWASVEKSWESAAERYREWFESALPRNAKKIKDNRELPEWYSDSPLVVSYPVRGTWDKDEMYPNAFYPYTNALPIINEVKEKTGSRILALLMHWEGTAPWAPPYVWPPYGGTENFCEFMQKLHQSGDMLGVYCSGFGYTKQSNLIADYNMEKEYSEQELSRGMCADFDGTVAISRICPSQRSGYDICPASPVGRKILDLAYSPIFESGLDYVQILDQNHGGGQYFCHSAEHGHPQAAGAWMTESMQNMLSDWNAAAKNMLFGCESAAAEPFVGNLLFSDNRFELNYRIGKAVPLYAYIYHEYLRNFMGNQVSCPFDPDADTLPYRIAYSFAAGDCMTLVFSPDGELMPNWGRPRHTCPPDKEKVLRFVKNLTEFYKAEAAPYLFCGRMTAAPKVECESVSFAHRESERKSVLPAVISTAWEREDGKKALILVNPQDTEAFCTVNGRSITLPALGAILTEI